MEISIQNNAENIAVIMNGNLDTLAAEQIDAQVKELETNVEKPLSIDCTALDYISSSGLRLLLRLKKAFGAKGYKVTLLNVNDNIMEVLKVTHFDKMFAIQ